MKWTTFKRSIPIFLILFLSSRSYAYQQIEFIREGGELDKKTRQHQLNEPRAVAISGDRLYVADSDAHRVVVMDQAGKTVLSWGAKGDKPGQFKSPAGIAIDEQGLVYIADTGNHRIQVFDAEGRSIRSFGAKGSAPREFNSPAGLFAQRGLLYVADRGNGRVQVLTTNGIFVRLIEVKNKNEMKAPVAVAADVQNKIYVLDRDGNSVRIFDHDGVQLEQFGTKGKGSEGFNYPQGLAVDQTGSIFVADTGNYKLKKFDPQGRLVASLGSEGSGPGQFREAAGLAVDKDGKVFVLDAEKHTFQVFTCEIEGKPVVPASPPAIVEFAREIPGEVAAFGMDKRVYGLAADSIIAVGVSAGRRIGSRGSEPGMFNNPRGLALDASGKFWVVDTGNGRLQKFSIEGNLLQVIGKPGSGEGEFDSPGSVAISRKGNLFVADTGNKRVQVFNARGMFLGMFGKPGKLSGQFSEPADITVDAGEHVYIADRGNNRIAKYDSNGTLVWEAGRAGKQDGEFSSPSNILVSQDNEVFVLDAGNARVQVFDTDGKFLRAFGSEGKGPGEFKSPQGLALEGGLRLYVGDRGNNRVQVFTLRQTPSVPKDITTQARVNEIQLGWKGGGESYLEQYHIYRGESAGGPFQLVGTATDPFFVDRGLPSDKTFYYRIASKAKEGHESAASTIVSAVTPKLIPAAPKKVRIEALEKQATLSWLPNLEPFVAHYRIYRTKQLASGFELLAQADSTLFIDSPLADETVYYYQVTAVGKEGDESPAGEVVFASTPKASLTVPPLEIATIEVGAIFSSSYKYYESHPAGRVVVRNNTDSAYPKVKLSFSIKDFMDYPSEIEIEQVPAREQVAVQLKPVFSNRILEVTENTPVQSEIALTYYIAGEAKQVTRSFPVMLYERHAMVWDQKAKLGAFVTPKDPPVVDFSRAVIRPYVDTNPNLHQSLVYARALYDALGVLGLKYIVDPTSPFQEFSEKPASVDYLAYPRDTLSRKSGDCDDLSILFAACMEDIGISTAFIDVPGHVFVMFNTGVTEKDKATLGFDDQMIVSYQGTIWIPVEMTMVGSSFTRAWQKGAEEYRDWSARGKIDLIETQKAWDVFKPVTLPNGDSKSARVPREAIEAAFPEELEALGSQRLALLSAAYVAQLKKDPNDVAALAQLGILYGENGLYAESLVQFQKVLALDKNSALAYNNIGNVSFLQERYEDARKAYEASLADCPDDTGIMANLTRVLLRLGRKEEAKKLFQNAAALDPRVLRQCGDLVASLGIVQ